MQRPVAPDPSAPVFKHDTPLNVRDRQMLKGLLEAKANKEIAFNCGLTVYTVKLYMTRLFRKIRVYNRMEAANWAREHQTT
jgi:DNA-binding NarL/FixJ family response regulator